MTTRGRVDSRRGRCLKTLLAAKYFPNADPHVHAYVNGCERYSQHDLRGAANAWRAIVGLTAPDIQAGNAIPRFAPEAFDAIGEHELAAKIDAQRIESQFDTFAGVSPAHVREARRALARGDKKKARALAKQIIDAWSAADVPVPAVADMRQLLLKTN